MFYYKVNIESDQISYESPKEKWGDWSAETEHNLVGVEVSTDDYPDLKSIHEFKDGDTCFIVWVQWSSGDSFGWHRGAYSEAFGIFKDKKCAEELATALRQASKQDKDDFNLETSDGQNFTFGYLPFIGYFERVDFIEVLALRVGNTYRARF